MTGMIGKYKMRLMIRHNPVPVLVQYVEKFGDTCSMTKRMLAQCKPRGEYVIDVELLTGRVTGQPNKWTMEKLPSGDYSPKVLDTWEPNGRQGLFNYGDRKPDRKPERPTG